MTEWVDPRRSRAAAITDAEPGVLTTASSALSAFTASGGPFGGPVGLAHRVIDIEVGLFVGAWLRRRPMGQVGQQPGRDTSI